MEKSLSPSNSPDFLPSPLRCPCSLASRPAGLSRYWKGACAPSPSLCHYRLWLGRTSVELFFITILSSRCRCLQAPRRKETSTISSQGNKHETHRSRHATEACPFGTVLPEADVNDELDHRLANLNQYEGGSHFLQTSVRKEGPDPANGTEEPAKLVRLRRRFTNTHALGKSHVIRRLSRMGGVKPVKTRQLVDWHF